MRRNTMAAVVAAVLTLALGACGSSPPSASDVTEGPGGQTSTSVPAGERVSTDSHCEAVLAFLSLERVGDPSADEAATYRTLLQDMEQAEEGAPPELLPSLQAVADFAQSELDRLDQNKPDPLFSGTPEELQRMADALMTYSQATFDIESWYRHQCGPPSASSAWCDSIAAGQLEISKGYADALSAASGSLPAIDQTLLDFYRALRAAAPGELQAPLDVIIQQYEGNGGKAPTDDASSAARDAAKSAIVAEITSECGEQIAHLV